MIKRRDIDENIRDVLERMLLSGETITARAVASGLGVSASTLTRDARRSRMIRDYQVRQKQLNAIRERTDPLSRTRLVQRLGLRDTENAILRRHIQLLTSANKAMLIAVADMGGTSALQKFFKDYESIRSELRALDASLSDLEPKENVSPPSLSFDPRGDDF